MNSHWLFQESTRFVRHSFKTVPWHKNQLKYEKGSGESVAKDGCCVFRPAFGCCAHPKAGQNLYMIESIYKRTH